MLVLMITTCALPCFAISPKKSVRELYGNVKGLEGIPIPAGVSAVEAITSSLRFQKVDPRSVWTWTVDDVLAVVHFNLFTKSNPEEAEKISYDQTTPIKYFNPEKDTKIYVHGWSSDGSTGLDFRNAYLSPYYPEVNYIEMLWNDASSYYYGFLRNRVSAIGQALSQLLDNLAKYHGLDLVKVHVLGYSAGAHIAGEAGRHVKTGPLGRITGLDPAGPLFEEENTSDRLSPDTAMLVDAIHTCSDQLGMAKPVGHIDFYPNNGTAIQPGCEKLDFFIGTCSHKRSVDFYVDSITNFDAPFIARHCDGRRNDFALMGEYLDAKSRGSFCLVTASTPPYSLTRLLHTNTIEE